MIRLSGLKAILSHVAPYKDFNRFSDYIWDRECVSIQLCANSILVYIHFYLSIMTLRCSKTGKLINLSWEMSWLERNFFYKIWMKLRKHSITGYRFCSIFRNYNWRNTTKDSSIILKCLFLKMIWSLMAKSSTRECTKTE